MFSYLEGIDTIVLSGEFAQTHRIFYGCQAVYFIRASLKYEGFYYFY